MDLKRNCRSDHLRSPRRSVITMTVRRWNRSEMKMAAVGNWGSLTKCGTTEAHKGPSKPRWSFLHIHRGGHRVVPVPNFKRFLSVVERNPLTYRRSCNGPSYLSVEGNSELMNKGVENNDKYGTTEPTTDRRVHDGPSQGSSIQMCFGKIFLK